MDTLENLIQNISINLHLIKAMESFLVLVIFFVLRFVITRLINKSAKNFDYQPSRVTIFKKMIRSILVFVAGFILLAIWGVKQTDIALFISSILTVLGIAFFAQWSILSNISSSVIIFFNHPVRIGDKLTIMDKDFPVEGKISDIGIFFITILSTEGEIVTIPSSVLMQKMIKKNRTK